MTELEYTTEDDLTFWQNADLNDFFECIKALDSVVYRRLLITALDHIEKELGK